MVKEFLINAIQKIIPSTFGFPIGSPAGIALIVFQYLVFIILAYLIVRIIKSYFDMFSVEAKRSKMSNEEVEALKEKIQNKLRLFVKIFFIVFAVIMAFYVFFIFFGDEILLRI